VPIVLVLRVVTYPDDSSSLRGACTADLTTPTASAIPGRDRPLGTSHEDSRSLGKADRWARIRRWDVLSMAGGQYHCSCAFTYGASCHMPIDPSRLDLPDKPGVYLFRRSDNRVMYIGKATNIRTRVRSYFSGRHDREMVPRLLNDSDGIDYIVTQSPSEALILERQLIRKHKPRHNSLLKDDKSYPFIALTNEQIPRVMYTRHPPEGSRIWGPFPDAGAAKRVVQLLRRQFGVRDCPELLPQGCLAMHIGLCAAPCIDSGDYSDRTRAVSGVLDGDGSVIIGALQGEMDSASERLDYEEAARVRDMIAAVQLTISQQIIHSRFYQDCDAIGFASEGDSGCLVIVHAEEGVVQGQTDYPLIHRGDIADSVSLVLSEHYANRNPPRTLLVPVPMDEAMAEWLSERRGGVVEVRVPKRGGLAKLREMSDRNAEVLVSRNLERRSGSLEQKAANEAAHLLGVDSIDHIVCFDMAQLMGEERVGASVVFRNGRPSKKEYRTYRVKSDSADDLKMMTEVIERWLKRQGDWPDLLLLDGGQTHLSAITEMLEKNGLRGRFPVAALAKREEILHMDGTGPRFLDRRGRVLIHARDEAHRFVNHFHKNRRGKKSLGDPLEQIGGLGAKKIQSLLRHFGGRKGINHATERELREVPGIGRETAKRINAHLRG